MNFLRKIHMPVAFSLLLISVALALATGYGVPYRQFIEGEFGYLNIVVVILTGVMFLRVYEASGAIDLLMQRLTRMMNRHPLLFLFTVMALLYIPGMFTGLGVPAVLIIGGLTYPLLMEMGFAPEKAVAFISLGAMLGSVTGPLNIPVMIIACAINMPYEGFGLILPAITVPMGIMIVLCMGARTARRFKTAENQESANAPRTSVLKPVVYLPIMVLLLLIGLPRAFPRHIPDLGTPLAFTAAMVCTLLTGHVKGMGTVLLKSIDNPVLDTAALLLSVGVLVQIATLTGIKGDIITACMSLPPIGIYLVLLIVLPLLGGAVSMLGGAALFGLPLVLALLGHNTIVVTAGCSVLCALSQLIPPTAIVSKVAGEVLGVYDYRKTLHSMLPYMIMIAVFSLLFVIFSNTIARILAEVAV
ncbi:MAG: TRAP transporter large permease subunit [Pyramidobacter sp.]|jgi:GntP family gluconate:H+ symporter